MHALLIEFLAKVSREDPVCGRWHVPPVQKCRVWCDGSHLALGIVLEVQGEIVKDAAWLRKAEDFSHINVAELEAVLKVIKLVLKWKMTTIEVLTDSAMVFSWLRSVVTEDC